MGVCVPDSCTEEDVEKGLVAMAEMNSPFPNAVYSPIMFSCEAKSDSLTNDWRDILFLWVVIEKSMRLQRLISLWNFRCFLCFLGQMVMIGTVLDVGQRFYNWNKAETCKFHITALDQRKYNILTGIFPAKAQILRVLNFMVRPQSSKVTIQC